MSQPINGSAVIVGAHRYQLERILNSGKKRLKTVMWIMLNPSTADGTSDDATIRKICAFARLWGYDRVLVGNVYSYRSTDPEMLKVMRTSAVGPENTNYLRRMMSDADEIICAWGNKVLHPDDGVNLVRELAGKAKTNRRKFKHLGITKMAQPSHPLYLPAATPRQEWFDPTW